MSEEHDLQNLIRMELSALGYCVFRANVGKVKLHDGRYFDTGLPKGFSDLFAVKDGKIYFLEVKTKKGRPTKDQLKFRNVMKNVYGCPAGICRSVEDAINLVNRGVVDGK